MNVKLIMYSADFSSELPLRFADQGIRAGFPSPAQDYMTDSIDLNRELIRHPATTFYARACGDSMKRLWYRRRRFTSNRQIAGATG